MSGMGMGGQEQPDTEGIGPDQEALSTSENPTLLVEAETTSIAVSADPGNTDPIYIGFSENVDDTTGFPLAPGAGISFDLDCSSAPIWAHAVTDGDVISFIGTS